MESLLTIENNLEPWLRRMNLRTGPILAIPIHFLLRAHAAIGPDTTLSRLCSLQPDFGLKADWLLEQCHRTWLAVKINGSWKCLILPRLADSTENTSWMIRRQRREGFCCLILLFCGLVVGKYTLYNVCHGNSENSNSCPYLPIEDLLHLQNKCEWMAELNPCAACWPRTRCFLHRCSRNFCRHYFKS